MAIRAMLKIAAMVIAGASVNLPAAPAAASVPKFQLVIGRGERNSTDKTDTVTCPKGTKVIDAGGYVTDGMGAVTLDDVFPDPDLTFVNATGLGNDTYTTMGWVVQANATCAAPLPGLEWIKGQTAANSSSTKVLTVVCSPGKTVLGSGYAITGGNGEVFVDEAVPNGGPGVPATQVTLIGAEGDAYDEEWDLDGFLICADPLPGQQVVSLSTAPSSSDASVFARCDVGQVATGATAELHNATGEAVIDVDVAYESGAYAQAQENDETEQEWWLTAYAFCANA